MALLMRERCQTCERALNQEGEALICSQECTYCPTCAAQLGYVCPNCAGEMVRRPRRLQAPEGLTADG
jgi:hypothetical protein